MIVHESFSRSHIQKIRGNYPVDNLILERSIFALALLEALVRVGMPFIFKGGTSLLLPLGKPSRPSYSFVGWTEKFPCG